MYIINIVQILIFIFRSANHGNDAELLLLSLSNNIGLMLGKFLCDVLITEML